MKNLTLTLTLILTTLFLGCNKSPIDKSQMVNPILGDISYENKFGIQPNATTDNNLRIKTHLEYVENLLRQKDVSTISTELQTKRTFLLDLLHTYWVNGIFPTNYDYPNERKTCFIDKDGKICAVGYLIEQTAGRAIAEEINSKFKYEHLLAMNDAIVNSWIQSSGLTKEECAMIQPAYRSVPTDNYISPAYGVSSSIIGGLNLSLNTINGIQISKGARTKTAPILGLITGAGQITLGALSYPKEQPTWGWGGPFVNPAQRNLSLINIGLGTSTLILSSWNLITNRKPKEKPLSWNIYSFPTQSSNMGLGFNLTRKF